jgi:uncharacterized protein (UPF0548 family)
LFLLREPSEERIQAFLREQEAAPFSYAETGTSLGSVPPGYVVDHNRVTLGEGEETFLRAAQALRAWKMFDTGWVRVHPADALVEVGTVVAVAARHGIWSLNACRIVYTVEDEVRGVRRSGFAYGTLPEHAARGEERFTVEWDLEDGAVWYDLYSISRPNSLLVTLGHPVVRRLQKRFARDSKAAMIQAMGLP